MYKFNLHFRRLLIITWHGKHRAAQINVKMFFLQGYVKKDFDLQKRYFLTVSIVVWYFRPPLERHRIHGHKNKYFKPLRSTSDLMQYFHKNNTSNTRQGKQQMHKMSQFTKLWRHFQADFVVIISYFKAHTTCLLDMTVEMFTW